MAQSEKIAIVAHAIRFPGSGGELESFWHNVSTAADCSREVPAGRWFLPPERCVHAGGLYPDSVPHARGYFLDPFTAEPDAWNVPAELLGQLDPLFHAILDTGHRAWRMARTAGVDRRRVGVILGNICLPTVKVSDLARERFGITPAASATHPWNRYVAGLPAGILAKSLGFGGSSFTLDAACASSLYAIKLACDELLAGRADAMLAGGANGADPQYTQMGFAQLRAISASGRCSPFDRAADGLMVGEGAGMVVLKRAADAVRDGDTILGLMSGWGLSNDMHGNLLAPAVEGQLRAMHAAYERAGWKPSDVELIECHATGTPVGDAIEFDSLRQLWGESGWKPGQCVIGSVKSTVGHLLTGAGVAALAKVLCAFAAKQRPPQANFQTPGSGLRYTGGPFRVLQQAEPWIPQKPTAPRRAAVSGFGFGGVNAHVLLEEYVGQPVGAKGTSVTVPALPVAEPVAVVGMAARFGPWSNLRSFQEHVLGGGDHPSPTARQNGWSSVPAVCPPGFYLNELTVSLARFRIPPNELKELLPQQVLMLAIAADALEDAGWSPEQRDDDPRTGVFVGLGLDLNTTNFHLRWATLPEGDRVSPPLTADRTMGALGSIAASRIARAFRFGGPSHTCCSEESSAGRALELAVQALRLGEVDRVLVGGVDLAGDPRVVLTQPPERVPGEGAAAVVLKRLSDAERDGDRVYAVIRGIGSAVGGTVTQPGPDAATVASSFLRACADGVIDPRTVAYLDGGTHSESQEEQAEIEAVAALLDAKERSYPLAVGNSRTQVGHTGFASALSGFVKAALALHHQILPPSIAVTPQCHAASGPSFWLKDDADGPRRAAITATGTDGTVCHVVLEESTHTSVDPQPLGARPEAVFAVRGQDVADLVERLRELSDKALSHGEQPIQQLAEQWHAAAPRTGTRTVGLSARNTMELREQIACAVSAITRNPDSPIPDPQSQELRPTVRDRVFYNPQPLGNSAKVAIVFPGSGNQFAGMGRDFSAHFPNILRQQQSENRRLRSQYAPDRFWADAIPAGTTAKQFLFGQVTHGTLGADLLRSLGIPADVLLGQSLGESAGLFGLRVWLDRDEMLGRIQQSTLFGSDLAPPYASARQFWNWPPHEPLDWISGLLAVPAESVRSRLRVDRKAYLLIVTTPTECVIGGLRADVEQLAAEFDAPFFPLRGVTLAHCEVGRPVEQPYRELHTLPTTPPAGLTLISGAWGQVYAASPSHCADSITAGLVGTIDFPRAINTAYENGVRIFLEVGPGNSTTRMISATLAGWPHMARAITAARQDELSLLMRCLAALVSEQVPVNLDVLYASPPRRETPLVSGPTLTIPIGTPPPAREPESVGTIAEQTIVPDEEKPLTELSELPQESGETEESVSAPHYAVHPQPQDHWQQPEPIRVEPIPRPVPLRHTHLAPFVAACADAQAAAGEAHNVFLRIQSSFTATTAAALQLHTTLMQQLAQAGDGRPAPVPVPASVPTPPSTRPLQVPRSLDREQCFEFARGKIGNVLGPLFEAIDQHPTRVRLPDGPLMLVDRILTIEGEPKSMTRGRVVTEHHVHAQRWYLDAGRIPTCVTVESGQADLFLSGFLGIDFQTRGLSVYRLIDAVIQFHRGLPVVDETIRYDIHIDEFIQQSDVWLFRFRFEATINGEPLLSMSNGVAGFFTAEALASGQGIIHTKLDRQPMPGKKPADWVEFVPLERCTLGPPEVAALRRGDLVSAFGPAFRHARLRSPMKLPGGMLRLLDRVPVIDPTGGRFGIGFVRAEYDVHPDDWFLTCHFVDDMVMPGTLMFECCLHTLRVLLMRMGWVGEEGAVATEPVPGVSSRLKCRGQVIASTREVAYEVSIKELGYGPEPYCIADALMYADGKPIVEITNMSLRMTGLTRAMLEAIWSKTPASPASASSASVVKPALYGPDKILAYSNGNPSEAFGPQYRIFDAERKIARLPGPPFQFLDRVTAVTGEPFVLKAGAACECQYDVPTDAWYFEANRCPRMPFSVLLEIALQPCGWLAAYCGSALTSDIDLSFRNLGGQAVQFLPIGPDIGTLTMTAKMTNVSQSGGMIIQHFAMKVVAASGTVYEGTTYFGFFAKEALANQVGMPQAKVPFLTPEQRGIAETGLLPHEPPFPAPMLRMVDRIDGYLPTGGRAGLGLVQGRITVDPSFWFFQAHFYQDPVWPGSLGLESFLQLLKFAAWKRWGTPAEGGWQTVSLHQKHEWTYRGQVVPSDKEVIVVLEITEVDDIARRLTADGFLTVDGRIIYQMNRFTLN
ncbi:MAG: hypothetical protein LC104_00305 [Bacteroidales bacterium]|nr:hypothetical protein [Bacteroidales bacterium]